MNVHRPAGVVVGLAVVAAIFVAMQPKNAERHSTEKSSRETRDETPNQSPTTNESLVAGGPLNPVWAFLGHAAGTPPTASSKQSMLDRLVSGDKPTEHDEGLLYAWPKAKSLEEFTLHFLIATVPDPVDSRYGYLYDQTVEAIQHGLDVDRYIIDRVWLPWNQRPSPDTKSHVRLHARHPGVMLFRSGKSDTNERQRLLVLLLVSETPTAGIHKTAFSNAVRIILDCPGHRAEQNRIRVLAPFFSGSAESLGIALDQARIQLEKNEEKHPGMRPSAEPKIKVICGSASGFTPVTLVKRSWAGVAHEGLRPFEMTVLPDSLILRRVEEYLANPESPAWGSPLSQVAVLQESNTAFGQDVSHDIAGDSSVSRSRATTDPSSGKGDHSPGTSYTVIPFPLHISQLRAAYTKEQLARLETQGLPRSSRDLPFPTDPRNNLPGGREAVPAQSPLMTAAVEDLILNHAISTIARKRIRHICLISSDIRDKIFLAQQVRQRHPNVQFYTVGADILLTHDDYNYALRGMIVGSTYPLYLQFQDWAARTDDNKSSRILFADQSCQGCYNATLAHLAGENRRAEITNRMLDYGWDKSAGSDRLVPGVWISVVGNNGQMIPLRYLPVDGSSADPSGTEAQFLPYLYQRLGVPGEPNYGSVGFPGSWFFLFTMFVTVNGYCFYLCWRHYHRSWWGQSINAQCYSTKQRADLAVVSLAQILFYTPIIELALIPLRITPTSLVGISIALLVLFFSSVMVAVPLGLLLWERRGKQSPWSIIAASAPIRMPFLDPEDPPQQPFKLWRIWKQSGFWIALADVVVFGLVLGACGCIVWKAWTFLDRPVAVSDVLRFERLVHLTNGVSPLLPRALFCTALFTWGALLVHKLYLLNRFSVLCPIPKSRPAAFLRLTKLDQRVREELRPPTALGKHLDLCLLVLVIIGVGLIKMLRDAIPPIDGVLFGRLSLIGFALGALVLMFTLLEFSLAWRRLRRLLNDLALLPLQNAFARLPDKVVSVFGNYLFSLRPRHAHLILAVQQDGGLREWLPRFEQELTHLVRRKIPLKNLDPIALRLALATVQTLHGQRILSASLGDCFENEARDRITADSESPLPEGEYGRTGTLCSRKALRCLRILRHFWPAYSLEEAFGRTEREPSYLDLPTGDPIREWATRAEDFVALETIRYLSQFVVLLRNLLRGVTIGSLLLILAATVYPFFPQSQLLLFLVSLAVVGAGAIVHYLYQMNCDELISRITRTSPNRFTPDLTFLHGSVVYVLPILAGVIMQFPFVTTTLRSLVEPLFHIIR